MGGHEYEVKPLESGIYHGEGRWGGEGAKAAVETHVQVHIHRSFLLPQDVSILHLCERMGRLEMLVLLVLWQRQRR